MDSARRDKRRTSRPQGQQSPATSATPAASAAPVHDHGHGDHGSTSTHYQPHGSYGSMDMQGQIFDGHGNNTSAYMPPSQPLPSGHRYGNWRPNVHAPPFVPADTPSVMPQQPSLKDRMSRDGPDGRVVGEDLAKLLTKELNSKRSKAEQQALKDAFWPGGAFLTLEHGAPVDRLNPKDQGPGDTGGPGGLGRLL